MTSALITKLHGVERSDQSSNAGDRVQLVIIAYDAGLVAPAH